MKTPEIIIVVDKLLTALMLQEYLPLYYQKSSRAFPVAGYCQGKPYPSRKDYGFIIDYYGVLKELDEALRTYTSYQDFDAEDLEFNGQYPEEIKNSSSPFGALGYFQDGIINTTSLLTRKYSGTKQNGLLSMTSWAILPVFEACAIQYGLEYANATKKKLTVINTTWDSSPNSAYRSGSVLQM